VVVLFEESNNTHEAGFEGFGFDDIFILCEITFEGIEFIEF
jgi:inosine/xanthosine triphosphate pyrophosphatase family protein